MTTAMNRGAMSNLDPYYLFDSTTTRPVGTGAGGNAPNNSLGLSIEYNFYQLQASPPWHED